MTAPTPAWALLDWLAEVLAIVVIVASLAPNLVYVALLCLACGIMLRRPKAKFSRSLWAELVDVAPPITIVVPAYNEEATIVESVRSLLALQYPNFRVIVVNDGSGDATLRRLAERFDLQPARTAPSSSLDCAPVTTVLRSARAENLLVLDKQNGGKADALNAGINHVETDYFCTIDADSLLEGDALLRVMRPFVEDPERVVAGGGTVRVANGCTVRAGRVREVNLPRRLLPLLQTVEYLRAFTMARLAWGKVGALMIVSGAFGVFRRDVALDVGGYSRDTVGEDMEIIVKIHRRMRETGRDYEIAFVPEPVCWTQVPDDLSVLARQRIRWHRGTLETFFRHQDMLLRPRYGVVGGVGFGHILLVDVLTPLIELVSYVLMPLFWYFGLVYWEFLAAWLALTFGFGIFVSIGTLILEELELRRVPRARDLALLALVAVVENLGYRQLNNLWRAIGHWRYLRGDKSWGAMRRQAFAG